MNRVIDKQRRRLRRKYRIRKKVYGTGERPRMTVLKSNKHMYVQIIDDEQGKTLAAASDVQKDFSSLKPNVANAEKLGELIGKRLSELKVKSVVFDRNGYKYHGIIRAIAEGTRKAGIQL